MHLSSPDASWSKPRTISLGGKKDACSTAGCFPSRNNNNKKKGKHSQLGQERNGLILTHWLPGQGRQDRGPELLGRTTIPRRQCEPGTLPASHQYSGAEEKHIKGEIPLLSLPTLPLTPWQRRGKIPLGGGSGEHLPPSSSPPPAPSTFALCLCLASPFLR